MMQIIFGCSFAGYGSMQLSRWISGEWSQQRLHAYNRDRFENLINADWDLIIVDEAHRLGGSTDQVARYRSGQG